MRTVKNSESKKKVQSLNEYIQQRVENKRAMGKNSTADLYQATGNHFLNFRNKKDIAIREITPTLIADFQSYLQAQNLKINTINSYMSCLRAIYNAAFNDRPFPLKIHPFRNIKLKRDITVKKPLAENMIRKIATANFRNDPKLALTADLTLFSFMAYGMPFADMVRLTKKNIQHNRIVYTRHKTGIQIQIEITPGMAHILSKYNSDNREYLFPVMIPSATHNQYKAMLAKHNKALITIGTSLGIHEHLTSYVLRHTWAAEARRLHVDISVISQAMGHTSEKTTRMYLNRLDQSELDQANQAITNPLNQILTKKLKGKGKRNRPSYL
ncbi:tyrosine-type recombinase/integrase [Parabacteroides sp.]